jgi:hypothetical protein
MQFAVGLKADGKSEHAVVEAEDARSRKGDVPISVELRTGGVARASA